jgi:hypothetical protein
MKRSQGYSALSGQKMERIHFQVVLCVKSNDKSRGVGRYREGTQCEYGERSGAQNRQHRPRDH